MEHSAICPRERILKEESQIVLSQTRLSSLRRELTSFVGNGRETGHRGIGNRTPLVWRNGHTQPLARPLRVYLSGGFVVARKLSGVVQSLAHARMPREAVSHPAFAVSIWSGSPP